MLGHARRGDTRGPAQDRCRGTRGAARADVGARRCRGTRGAASESTRGHAMRGYTTGTCSDGACGQQSAQRFGCFLSRACLLACVCVCVYYCRCRGFFGGKRDLFEISLSIFLKFGPNRCEMFMSWNLKYILFVLSSCEQLYCSRTANNASYLPPVVNTSEGIRTVTTVCQLETKEGFSPFSKFKIIAQERDKVYTSLCVKFTISFFGTFHPLVDFFAVCRHGMSAFAACCDCRCGRPAPWNLPDAGPHCDEHPASHPCHSLSALNATATRRCAYQENGPREGRGGISRPGAVGRDRGRGNCAQALLPERYILGGTNSQTPKLHSGFLY
jgi:hypothetical protein